MSLLAMGRRGVGLCLVAILAGCSSSSPTSSSPISRLFERSDDCERNRRACIYEGKYEAGEKDYAEEEAKRLNRAQVERLRRGR